MKIASTKGIETIAKRSRMHLYYFLLSLMCANICMAQGQTDSTTKTHQYKNVIRYNLTGALLFGFDKFIIFGYERLITPRQSISVNFGKASLPKFVSINTDSVSLEKDIKNKGTNISVDYRFYLAKENKYLAPHGLYIGPYYAYNQFTRDNQWKRRNNATSDYIYSNGKFNINTIGFELGYQLMLWKRLAFDFVMVGPGVGFYNYKVKFDSNIDGATQDQLLDGLEQLLKQKFPGMNYVFADKEISGDGTLSTTAIGYRYLVHIGFVF